MARVAVSAARRAALWAACPWTLRQRREAKRRVSCKRGRKATGRQDVRNGNRLERLERGDGLLPVGERGKREQEVGGLHLRRGDGRDRRTGSVASSRRGRRTRSRPGRPVQRQGQPRTRRCCEGEGEGEARRKSVAGRMRRDDGKKRDAPGGRSSLLALLALEAGERDELDGDRVDGAGERVEADLLDDDVGEGRVLGVGRDAGLLGRPEAGEDEVLDRPR